MSKAKKRAKPPIRANSPFFCDTTIIYYRLHSHRLCRKAVLDARGSRLLKLSLFVRGEYIKGFIHGLIVLYTTIQAENHVDDGIQSFLNDNHHRPRRVQNVLTGATTWLRGFDEAEDVQTTLERLGDFICFCLNRLDEEFPQKLQDPLECEHGKLDVQPRTFDEDQLLDIYERVKSIRKKPDCEQCSFRANQLAKIAELKIDFYSDAQVARYSEQKGYVRQAKHAAKAERSKLSGPSCQYCDYLGDTIIALQAPEDMPILTGDFQSFPALVDILGKNAVFIPTLDDLKRAK